MKLKDLAIVGIVSASFGIASLMNPQSVNASFRSFSRSWVGSYRGPHSITISTHYFKLGAYKSRVSFINKATHGYYDVHFMSEQPLYLKRKGNKLALRYLPNDTPEIYTRTSSNPLKYKDFHGYRIEGRKSLYTYNTTYETLTHDTVSDYRPTQTSKVIFKYGSHVYPILHEWAWVHGDSVTYYRYDSSWYETGTY